MLEDVGLMDQVWVWVQHQITNNDIFAGIVGGSILLSVIMLFRNTPNRLWQLFLFQCTVSMVVFSEDDSFEGVNAWFAQHPYAKKARRMKLSSHWVGHDEGNQWSISPGAGRHFLWYKKRLIWLDREISEGEKSISQKRRETLVVRTFGRNQRLLRDMVGEARLCLSQKDVTNIYLFKESWRRVATKNYRPLDSIILPKKQLSGIVQDVKWFLGSREWYAERGVPYRRGYMLSGPPGCGKTSLALGLASELDWPVYALNLGSVRYDDELFDAMSSVPRRAILLLEDIDAVGHARIDKRNKDEQDEDRSPLSTSAVLNSIDGVMSTDGRLMIVTTNYPEKLDPALVRPGRIDRHEIIGPAGPAEARRLFEKFYPCVEPRWGAELESDMGGAIPAAILQGIFMRHSEDHESAIKEVLGVGGEA